MPRVSFEEEVGGSVPFDARSFASLMGITHDHCSVGGSNSSGSGTGSGGGGGDGVARSQCINSPRYAGTMTRRAQSFKRGHNSGGGGGGGVPEIELQINSPRSSCDSPSSPVGDGAGDVERRQAAHLQGHQAVLRSRLPVPQLVGKGLFKKSAGALGADFVPRERRKLRNLMFFCFCGLCLLLGLAKICATRWVGLTASDQVGLSPPPPPLPPAGILLLLLIKSKKMLHPSLL